MRLSLGQRVEQEVGEVAAEHLFEPGTRRYGLRVRLVLRGSGLGR